MNDQLLYTTTSADGKVVYVGDSHGDATAVLLLSHPQGKVEAIVKNVEKEEELPSKTVFIQVDLVNAWEVWEATVPGDATYEWIAANLDNGEIEFESLEDSGNAGRHLMGVEGL